MSFAVALVLASAFLHALWNGLLRRRGESRAMTVAVLSGVFVFALIAAVFAPRPWFGSRDALLWAVASGVCEAGYFAALGRALTTGTVSLVYPVSRGGALLVAWPISVAFLGETITIPAVTGAGLVLAGILITSLRRPEHGTARALAWAALSAAFIGGYSLLYKQALRTGAEPRALFAASMCIALPLNLVVAGGTRRAALTLLRTEWRLVGLTALASCGSFWLFLFALRLDGAGALLTLRNTSIVFSQLITRALGERVTARQAAGAAVIAAGAIVLGVFR